MMLQLNFGSKLNPLSVEVEQKYIWLILVSPLHVFIEAMMSSHCCERFRKNWGKKPRKWKLNLAKCWRRREKKSKRKKKENTLWMMQNGKKRSYNIAAAAKINVFFGIYLTVCI